MYRRDHTTSLVEVLVLLACTGGGAYLFLLVLKFVFGIDLFKNDTKSRVIICIVIVLFLMSLWAYVSEH